MSTKCDSSIHENPVPAVVSGLFRSYYQPSPEGVRANYCRRCADGIPRGMFTADKDLA